MVYKSKDPRFYIEQLKYAFVHDLAPEEFNAKSKELIEKIGELSSSGSRITPRYCFPEPTKNFFNPDNTQSLVIEDVYLFHGEPYQVYRSRNSNSRHAEPSRVLHRIIKTSLEGQVGFAFVSPEIHLSHFEAVFVPFDGIPLLHTWAEPLPGQ